MRYHVDLDGRVGKRLERTLEKLGWVRAPRNRCDVIFSKKPDPMVPTVLVTREDPEITDTVIDVIRGNEPEDVLKLKLRLYETFLNIGDYMDYLEEEFIKSKRYSLPLSVVLFRVLDEREDSFTCLMGALKEYARQTDKVFRIGDFDVLVVLNGTDIEGADVFVKRIAKRYVRDFLKKNVLKEPDFVYGVAEAEDWMVSAEDLISSAEYDLLSKMR